MAENERTLRGGVSRHRLALLVTTLVVVLAAAAAVAYWLLHARYYESTDDAYVAGNLVQATPQIEGTVITVGADETDRVARGQLLVALDPSRAEVVLARAEADLAKSVRQSRNLFASDAQFQAAVAVREVELKRAEQNLARRSGLDADGVVSSEEVQHARDEVSAARAALELDTERMKANRTLTSGTTLARYPDVLAAAARVREAYLDVLHTRIASPVSGYVAARNAQVGQHVAPGVPLMAIVPLEEVWVDANFKEDQLREVRIGQPVTLVSDLYGGEVPFHGTVAGLAAGTGSALSVLPAQNATGNWVKVVQRVPVRIRLERKELERWPLRVGLSMAVTIDLHDTRGPVLAAQPPAAPPYALEGQGAPLRQADRLIDRIISDNAGRGA